MTIRAVTLLGLAALLPAAAEAAMSEADIKAAIEKQYPVQVLRQSQTDYDGRAAIAVTVMNKGANSATAFQVNTLLVDPDTGKLLPQFRHKAAGYELAPRLGGAPPSEGQETLTVIGRQ
ncbi:MAG: hypothetical protein EXQ92_01815 [Alphaproteobacteria bacterium]|nr:hypothetical protein [Alphaproteobacteria bacterium]